MHHYRKSLACQDIDVRIAIAVHQNKCNGYILYPHFVYITFKHMEARQVSECEKLDMRYIERCELSTHGLK